MRFPFWLSGRIRLGGIGETARLPRGRIGRLRMSRFQELLVVVLAWVLPLSEGQETGDVRLVNGGATFQGRVELFFADEWGTVCSDIWQLRNSDVVCKQLGYTHAVAFQSFGAGSGPIVLDDVSCVGNEGNLLLCDHNPVLHTNCDHSEDIGVICAHKVGDLQLTGYDNNPYEGRVEVFNGQTWTTVCDDGWDKMDADVVCTQLGYPGAVQAVSSQHFNTNVAANMLIWFSEVQCQGTEKTLDDCAKTVVNASSSVTCSHVEDAGVVCQQQDDTTATSTNANSGVSDELLIVAGVVAAVVFITLLLIVVCVVIMFSMLRGRKEENKSNEGGSSKDGSTVGLAGREENGTKPPRTDSPLDTMEAGGVNTGQSTIKVEVYSAGAQKRAEDAQQLMSKEMREEDIEKRQAVSDV